LESTNSDCDAFVNEAVNNWRRLPLRPNVRAMLEYAEKLTLRPTDCIEEDVHDLRAVGWTDNDIHDTVQVASYFNYINRIADSLGIEFEPGHPRWGRK
jgi:uncharacterized peroxidase-related enzyme